MEGKTGEREKMTKRDKTTLSNLLGLGFVLLGIYLWYKNQVGGIIGFFAIFIVATTIPHILISLIFPDKKEQKKKQKNKAISNKPTIKIEESTSSSSNKKKHNLLRSEKEILSLPLEQLSWREFERLCYLYYKSKGYNVEETREGADGGVDLIYYHPKHRTKVAVQIKFWSKKAITVDEIRNLDSSKKNYKCYLAEFITSSTYTQAAKIEADSKHIEWHDKNWVELKLLKWREKEAKKQNQVS